MISKDIWFVVVLPPQAERLMFFIYASLFCLTDEEYSSSKVRLTDNVEFTRGKMTASTDLEKDVRGVRKCV